MDDDEKTTESPDLRDLYYQAKGDPEKYKSLLRLHGLLVRRTEEPKPHVFNGLTPSCLCSSCQARFDAPWHRPADAASRAQ